MKKIRRKTKVAIVCGGESNERDVSLLTGKTVAKNLDKKKFSFVIYDPKTRLNKFFKDARDKKFDVVFIALHGKGGEDGTIQGMLELINMPYTGSGVLSSALCMNKELSKKIFEKENIPTPDFLVFQKQELKNKGMVGLARQIKSRLGVPFVIKPANSGSSVGVFIIKKEKELGPALKKSLKEDDTLIFEKYVKGTEITVGVLGNENLVVLPVVGIYPKKEFFDYQAKYNPEFCEEIAPAPIPERVRQEAQSLALKSYKALKCRGFSRIDMIWQGKKVYVLEVNTIPGLTPASLLPKGAKAAGISFPRLLEKIINFAK